MLQEEFENRTNLKVTADEFGYINSLYMDTNMDKDSFCKEYLKVRDSLILADVFTTAETFKATTKKLNDTQFSTAQFLADQVANCKDLEVREELRSEAISLMGCKEYLKYILKQGYELTELDKENIIMLLSE